MPKRADRGWHQRVHGSSARKTDAERSSLPPSGALSTANGPLDLLGKCAYRRQKCVSRFGQFRSPRDAMKQSGADFDLKVAYLLTERRLSDPEAGGRAGEVALLCHGKEITDVSQLHGISITYRKSLRYILEP